jgi:hypothetical protein
MKKQKEKKYGNPVAKYLNMVTKPATMPDKKKEQSKTYCRKEKNDD